MIYLSIILPAYKVEKYLIRCLDSIYNQNIDISLFETIVVDDGSPDECFNIAKKYFESYPNGKVIMQDNRGLGGARNTGLKASRGKYVWFVDTDDEILPKVLGKVLSMLKSASAEIYSFSYAKNVEGKEEIVQLLDDSFKGRGAELVRHFMLGPVWTNIYSRFFLLNHELFFKEHFFHEDGEFNMRAVTLASLVRYTPMPIYRYYSRNPHSIMNSVSMRHIDDYLQYIDSFDEFNNKYIVDSAQAECLKRYLCFMLSCVAHEALRLEKKDYVIYQKKMRYISKRLKSVIRSFGLKKYILYSIILMAPPKTIIKILY